jgi:hypothetical protein
MEIIKKSNKQILNSKATNMALDMAKVAGDPKYSKYEKLLEKVKILRDALLAKYHSKAMTKVKQAK